MERRTMSMLLAGLLSLTVSAKDYNIVEYGAKNDTTVLSTAAVQQAIDRCSEAGVADIGDVALAELPT